MVVSFARHDDEDEEDEEAVVLKGVPDRKSVV